MDNQYSNSGDEPSAKAYVMRSSYAKKPRLENGAEKTAKKKTAETLEDAMQLAEKAASGAEAAATQKATTKPRSESVGESSTPGHHRELAPNPPQNHQAQLLAAGAQTAAAPQIPHSTDHIHSVDLPLGVDSTMEDGAKVVADCTNSIQIPQGSSGSAMPCTVLSSSSAGQSLWKDQLPGTSCSAIAASKNLLAVGTSDGCVQLYEHHRPSDGPAESPFDPSLPSFSAARL